MINETFAQMSNLFVYSAMAVYTLAMLAFAWDLSGRSRPARRAESAPADSASADSALADVATADSIQARSVRAELPVRVGAAGGGSEATGDRAQRSAAGSGPDLSGRDRGPEGLHDGSGPRVPGTGHDGAPSRWLGSAVALTWLAALLHLGAVLTRGLSASRVPWANMYEFTLTGALVASVLYLGLVQWRRDLRVFGLFVVGPVLLALGLGMTVLYTAAAHLVPALQSPFLVIHVSIAFISVAILTIAFSVHVLYLVQGWRERRLAAGSTEPRGGRFMARLGSAATLEQLGYRLVVVAFPLWTFTLVAGAIWAEKAWGRYWGWDPKEVWTFVVWVIYAAFLHARATRGWDGRRATWIAIAGWISIVINFTVVNLLFTGQHSYAGIG